MVNNTSETLVKHVNTKNYLSVKRRLSEKTNTTNKRVMQQSQTIVVYIPL
jgi:hypothetical protein